MCLYVATGLFKLLCSHLDNLSQIFIEWVCYLLSCNKTLYHLANVSMHYNRTYNLLRYYKVDFRDCYFHLLSSIYLYQICLKIQIHFRKLTCHYRSWRVCVTSFQISSLALVNKKTVAALSSIFSSMIFYLHYLAQATTVGSPTRYHYRIN